MIEVKGGGEVKKEEEEEEEEDEEEDEEEEEVKEVERVMKEEEKKKNNKLLFLQGLHEGFVEMVLKRWPGQYVEPVFVDCLAARRAFRPGNTLGRQCVERMRRRRGGGGVGVGKAEDKRYQLGGYIWEYPELVEGLDVESYRADVDAMGRCLPPVIALPGAGNGKFAVIFSRLGFWHGKAGDVLFLDQPLWKAGLPGVSNASRELMVFVANIEHRTETTQPTREQAPALQDVLIGALEHCSGDSTPELGALIDQAIYNHWLDLFDTLDARPQTLCDGTVAFYGQMMRSMEFNEEGENNPSLHSGTFLNPSGPSCSSQDGTKKPPIDENQRALDRLSYLGGVLVPLPIVASVLSMGETYGPGGEKFYMFWAVALPLSALTVLLIYADTIRKAEVWVEIGSERVVPSLGSLISSPPELTPLEQEVLEEYERLAENMKKLPATGILDGLRELERKTSLVFTLLKASVYSIVLQQEIDWGGGQGHDGGMGRGARGEGHGGINIVGG
ncbi:hypothetical protein N0V88_000299 [Collariella sp. IMI 366227]|nr:hypothetical protein N0V88_000299 [Collariella sp. IMI 366227]